MTLPDGRILILLLWGGGCVLLAARLLSRRVHRFRVHRNDRRKAIRRGVRRDVLSGLALLLTALGSAFATALVLFGQAGSGPRGFATAIALGAFVGALFIMATEEDVNGEAPHDRAAR